MSEDIDYKIQLKNSINCSRSNLIKKLSAFRNQIISAINSLNLTIGEEKVRNEGKYQRITLNYPNTYSHNSILRENLLLEFTFADIRLPSTTLTINTIIEDVLTSQQISSRNPITCISLEETAAEKWVGLTRRIAAIERGYHYDDSTLIRHLYDLSAIQQENRITDTFVNLALEVIKQDAQQFKNQHPEYVNNPEAEIRHSLAILQTKELWKQRYDQFLDSMVYDRTTTRGYSAAISLVESLSERVFITT